MTSGDKNVQLLKRIAKRLLLLTVPQPPNHMGGKTYSNIKHPFNVQILNNFSKESLLVC